MKKIVLALGVAVALTAGAAVPVQFKVETDHADCLYRCGEKASFTITVTRSSTTSERRFLPRSAWTSPKAIRSRLTP